MIGHSVDDLSAGLQRAGQVRAVDMLDYLKGTKYGGPLQRQMVKDAYALSHALGLKRGAAMKVGRFAGRAMPLLSAVGNVADVADIIAGDESAGNKAMDATAMALGGTAGFLLGGGPLGASVGAGIGKWSSDGLQWLFGDKKTPEQRKMEEALALLNRGGL